LKEENLSDLKTQYVPRSKQSLPRLKKTSQTMPYREKISVCSEIQAKYVSALWAELRISEC